VRHRHVTLLFLAALALGLAGVGFSDVVVGEHVACTPTHTIADNGTPLGEIAGECVTATDQTVTGPTTTETVHDTVTETVTTTVTAPPPPPLVFVSCGETSGSTGLQPCSSGAYWIRTFESPESIPARYPPYCCGPYWETNLESSASAGLITADPLNAANQVFDSHVANSAEYGDWAKLTQNIANSHASQGSDVWVAWEVYFPSTFKPCGYRAGQPNCSFNWVFEFSDQNDSQCPGELIGNAELAVLDSSAYSDGFHWRGQVYGGNQASGNCSVGFQTKDGPKIPMGQWLSMVSHVRFSNGADGLFETWQDGAKVMTISGPTLYKHPNGNYASDYLHIGYYRAGGDGWPVKTTWAADVYYDDIREGPSSASVGFTP
jgi:hypothetical protein